MSEQKIPEDYRHGSVQARVRRLEEENGTLRARSLDQANRLRRVAGVLRDLVVAADRAAAWLEGEEKAVAVAPLEAPSVGELIA